jgi:hypothetical protein
MGFKSNIKKIILFLLLSITIYFCYNFIYSLIIFDYKNLTWTANHFIIARANISNFTINLSDNSNISYKLYK